MIQHSEEEIYRFKCYVQLDYRELRNLCKNNKCGIVFLIRRFLFNPVWTILALGTRQYSQNHDKMLRKGNWSTWIVKKPSNSSILVLGSFYVSIINLPTTFAKTGLSLRSRSFIKLVFKLISVTLESKTIFYVVRVRHTNRPNHNSYLAVFMQIRIIFELILLQYWISFTFVTYFLYTHITFSDQIHTVFIVTGYFSNRFSIQTLFYQALPNPSLNAKILSFSIHNSDSIVSVRSLHICSTVASSAHNMPTRRLFWCTGFKGLTLIFGNLFCVVFEWLAIKVARHLWII